MTKEHLIQCIKYLGSLLYNFPWEDLIVSISSAFIGGIVAFYVAKYQVKKSNDQNNLQRKQDIKQQQLFMIDELKLKMSQEILDSTITVNANILNMINLRYKMQEELLLSKLKGQIKNNKELKFEILNMYEVIQDYLSNLYTVTELFDFNTEEKGKFELLNQKLKDFYDFSNIEVPFNPESIEERGQECLDLVDEQDQRVRQKHIDLIRLMKDEST